MALYFGGAAALANYRGLCVNGNLCMITNANAYLTFLKSRKVDPLGGRLEYYSNLKQAIGSGGLMVKGWLEGNFRLS